MKKNFSIIFILTFLLTACSLPASRNAPAESAPTEANAAAPTDAAPASLTPAPPTAGATFTPVPPPATETPTAVPFAESLDATVTADVLSCRYGPGAEYLYLYGLNKGANIKLIGRTDGNNWAMVKGKNLCWINTNFVEIDGDPQMLKVTYPGEYKLPVSPYYTAPVILSAKRKDNSVKVMWIEVDIRDGDEEEEGMFVYIAEIWRCEGGKIIFEPLATNDPEVTFVDEAGCAIPSHGRVFIQEKHGFAGPSDIPWPPQE